MGVSVGLGFVLVLGFAVGFDVGFDVGLGVAAGARPQLDEDEALFVARLPFAGMVSKPVGRVPVG